MHVVQISIMHINALKTQLMHKNVQTNPKNPKNWHNTPIVLCWHEKILKAIRGNGYRFVSKGGTFPTENHHACCEKLWFVRSITQTCPKWDKFFTTVCWCRFRIACQISWISDEFWIYYNLKTRHLNVLPAINGALVFEIHSHFLHGT